MRLNVELSANPQQCYSSDERILERELRYAIVEAVQEVLLRRSGMLKSINFVRPRSS